MKKQMSLVVLSSLIAAGLLVYILFGEREFAEASAPEKPGPSELRVLSATPSGLVQDVNQFYAIIVIFNQSVVPLQALPEGDGSGPLVITPSVRGKFRWMGTQTLAFIPSDPLPLATGYRVTIPSGLKSISGSVLARDYSWSFETQRPQFIRDNLYTNQSNVVLQPTLLLAFNQQIAIESARQSIRLRNTTTGAEVSASVDVATADEIRTELGYYDYDLNENDWEGKVIRLKPRYSLEMETSYRIDMAGDLRGTVGSLTMGNAASLEFQTYGPLRIDDFEGPAYTNYPVRLKFSNSLNMDDAKSHIHFIPEAELSDFYESWDGDYYLYGLLKPSTTYTIQIDENLTDIYGNRLGQAESRSFHSGDYESRIDFPAGNHVIESYLSHNLNVFALNPGTVSLKMAKLTQEDLIQLETTGKSDHLQWAINRSGVPPLTKNVQKIIPILLDDVLSGERSGAVCVEVHHSGWYSPQRAVIQLTDLGVTAKTSQKKNIIWVTSLRDGAPASGAFVEIRDDVGIVKWRGQANAHGIVETPGWEDLGMTPKNSWSAPQQFIFAARGDQKAFATNDMDIPLYGYRIPYRWGAGDVNDMSGYAFTNQGIYRPGDVVRVKVMARQRKNDQWQLAGLQRIDVKIKDSDYKDIHSSSVTLNAFGGADFEYTIAEDAPLGYYQVQLSYGKNSLVSTSFQVQEFKPVEVEVTVKTEKTRYIWGETLRGTLDGHYLFGMPLSQAPMRWHISRSPTSFTPEGWDGYYFGVYDRSYDDFDYYYDSDYRQSNAEVLTTKNDTLNERGLTSFEWPLRSTAATTSTFIIEGTVTDKNRQEVSGRGSVLVHAGQFYIGLKPATTFHTLGKPLAVQAVTVDPDGTIQSYKPLRVELIRHEWISVRQQAANGNYHWVTTSYDTVESVIHTTTQPQPRDVLLQPAKAGSYRIRATGSDAYGNVIATECYVYVTGAGYAGWRMSDDDRIELVADKKSYNPGDVAKILVKSPYDRCRALVTVEREGILSHRTVDLIGNAMTLDVPVTRDFMPNCFISVILLKGRTALPTSGRTDDLGKPSFKMGYVELAVNADENRLRVQLQTAKERYGPHEWVDLDLQVKDRSGAGRAAEVVVYVQDIGVLNLVGYSTPDPFSHFYQKRDLAVKTLETRKLVLEQISEKDLKEKGMAGGGGGEDYFPAVPVRKDFKSCVYWNASVATDAGGRARVRFQMPENLSGFRVMAVAQTTTSQFGSAQKSITVSKDLMLRPALPRFARVGDELEAGVIVHNYSERTDQVRLQVDASGVELNEEATRTFSLKKDGAEEVRFRFKVKDQKEGRFAFRAVMGSLSDGVEMTIPLKMPSFMETVATSGSLTESRQERIRVPSQVASGKGGVAIRTSSTALVDLDESVNYLFEYPYGCLEQKTSRVLPMILFADIVEAFGLPGLKDADGSVRRIIEDYLAEIGDYQLYNGAFAYWKGSPYESPYVSVYAMFALIKARQQGYAVNRSVIDKGMTYLKTMVRQSSFDAYGLLYWHSTRALALNVLAENGYYDAPSVELLYQRRDELPLYARAMLLKAIHTGRGNRSMMDELRRDVMNAIKMNPTTAHFEEPADYGLHWCFHSNLRTTAAVLETFLSLDGQNVPWAEKVVKYLLEDRRSGRWRTTQENVYAFWALGSYFRTFEAETPNFTSTVVLDGRKILEEIYRGRSVTSHSVQIPLDDLKRDQDLPLDMNKQGPGRMYYTVRMNYSPLRGVAIPARDEGIAVEKRIEDMSGSVVSQYRGGETYRIRLTLKTAQDRHFVVVDDPLPAGFEALNANLATASQNQRDQRRRAWWMDGGFTKSEMRDDRVVAFADLLPTGSYTFTYLVRATSLGQFALPPTKVEEMYAPEVFGNTVNGTVTIR